MIYTIGAIITALGALGSWIYALLQHNKSLQYQVAQVKANAEIKEFQDQIDASKGKVVEDVKDFSDAVNNFNNNNK